MLTFVPGMEISGNERYNFTFLTLNMIFRTHIVPVYIFYDTGISVL